MKKRTSVRFFFARSHQFVKAACQYNFGAISVEKTYTFGSEFHKIAWVLRQVVEFVAINVMQNGWHSNCF
jgi:hypothetical protein